MSPIHRHKIELIQFSFHQFYIGSVGNTGPTIDNGLENPGSALKELTDERNTLLTGAFTVFSQFPPALGKENKLFTLSIGGLDFSKCVGLGREINDSGNLIRGFNQTLLEEALFDLLQWLLIWKKALWSKRS